jgi:neutral ceramidase
VSQSRLTATSNTTRGREASDTCGVAMKLRRSLAILLAAGIAAVACSSGGSSSSPGPASESDAGDAASPYDNDTARLAHCTFQPSPAQATKPAPAPGAIRAGIGSAVLSLPIGVPFGGYTERSQALGSDRPVDSRAFRWAKDFLPSLGVYDAPRVEALALEVGGERWVLVRMDAVLILAPAIYAVEDAVAPDGSMRGRITISASHSHSAWAGWQPTYWLLPGVDKPRKDLFDRVVATIASAVNQALASLAPAKLGFAVDSAFDPTDIVSHDRRPENNAILGPDGNTAGKNKDPYVWALRVDHADGTPMAAMIDLAIHGTVGDDPNEIATTDAPGAIARALSAKLGYPVMHLQGVTGDIAPSGPTGRTNCPDNPHCLDIPRLEALGAHATSMVAPLIQGIHTDAQAVMEVVSRPSYVGHAGIVHRSSGTTLYYTPATEDYIPDGKILDSKGWAISPIDEFDAPAGAGLCGNAMKGSISAIPGDRGVGVYNSCLSISRGGPIVFGIFDMPTVQLPLCDSVRMTTTAVRFSGLSSGAWLVLAAPGEPTAPISSYLRGQSPAGRDHTLIMGYSDYGGYMLSTEDWLAGGYETSVNIWGPMQGEMVMAGLLESAAIAWTPQIEDPQAGATRSVNWTWPGDSPVTVTTTTDHGTLATPTGMFWLDTKDPTTPVQPPATVPRGVGVARFSWYGGDPAVDFPEVVLEVSQGLGFVPVKDARGNSSSSYEGAMVVTYLPDPISAATPAHHIYSATWQAVPPDPFSLSSLAGPFSLPLGTYRLHAHGKAQSSTGVVSYDIASASFQVVAAPLATASGATRGTSTITVTALAGPAPGLRALRDGASDGNVPLPGPLTIKVTLDDTSTQTATTMPDANGNATMTVTGLGPAHVTSVDVRDPAGNGGTLVPM